MLLALGIVTSEAIGVFVVFAAPIVLPMMGATTLAIVWPAVLLAALLMLSLRMTPATERHPALSQIYGVVDERGRSWLVSPLERPDDWTRQVLAAGGRSPARARMPLISNDPVWRVPATRLAVPSPSIVAAREMGWTRIAVSPASGGRTLSLMLTTARPLRSISANGRAVPRFADRAGTFKLRWQSAGEPIVLRFRTDDRARISLTAAEITQRRLPLPSRPPHVVAWLGSDRMIAMQQATWP